MTFPQIPLGDDGELDIDDSHEFPALRVYKPKHNFLRSNWPFLLIGLYPLIFIMYQIFDRIAPKVQYPFNFDGPINYQMMVAYNEGSLFFYTCVGVLLIAVVSLIGLIANSRYSLQVRSLAGLGFVGLSIAFSWWMCISGLSGFSIKHVNTLDLDDHHYNLAMAYENNFDIGTAYPLVFKCQLDDTHCVYLPTKDLSTASVIPTDSLKLNYDKISGALYIEYQNDIFYQLNHYVDENISFIPYPASLRVLTPANIEGLQELAQITYGRPSELLWSNDGSKLLVFGYRELQWYGLQNGQINPRPNRVEIENYTPNIVSNPSSPVFGINSADRGLIIFDRDTLVQTNYLPSPFLAGRAINSTGTTVAFQGESASGNAKIQLWDRETNAQIAELSTNYEYIHSVSFSDDNRYLAASVRDTFSDIKIWNLETFEEIDALSSLIESTSDDLKAIIFQPTSHNLAFTFSANVVRIWNVESGEQIGWFPISSNLISRNRQLFFNHDGRMLVSIGGGSNEIYLWDTQTESRISTLPYEANALAFNPDGTMLAFADADGFIRLWGIPEN
jgi:hypothetical protein